MEETREQYIARINKLKKQFKTGDQVKLEEGESIRARVIPYSEQSPHYTVELHYGVGPGRSTCLCNRSKNQQCYVCDQGDKLSKAGKTELAKLHIAQSCALFILMDMDNLEDGAKWLRLPPGTANKLLDASMSVAHYKCLDPILGRVVTITKPKKGAFQTYDLEFDPQATPLKDEWLKKVPALEAKFRVMSYGEQKVLYEEGFEAARQFAKFEGKAKAEPENDEGQDVTDESPPMEANVPPPTPVLPQPVTERTTSPKGSKPKCFGKLWLKDDPLCVKCPWEQECIPICQAATATN